MPIIENISLTLEDEKLLVVFDLNYEINEDPSTHPDNPIKDKVETREVEKIHSAEYLFNGKYGIDILSSLRQKEGEILEKKIIEELEDKSIQEIKTM